MDSGTDARVARLETSVDQIKGDLAEIKTDIREMRGDISTLTEQGNAMRGDIGTLRTDVTTLKERVNHLPTKKYINTAVAAAIAIIAAMLLLQSTIQTFFPPKAPAFTQASPAITKASPAPPALKIDEKEKSK